MCGAGSGAGSGGVYRSVVLPIAVIAIIHACGIAVFTGGFFLSRFELTNHSRCESTPLPPSDFVTGSGTTTTGAGAGADGSSSQHSGSCWLGADTHRPPLFDRAIILIVDALRFDSAYLNESIAQPIAGLNSAGSASVPFYQNRLTSIHHALRSQPARARIFHFGMCKRLQRVAMCFVLTVLSPRPLLVVLIGCAAQNPILQPSRCNV